MAGRAPPNYGRSGVSAAPRYSPPGPESVPVAIPFGVFRAGKIANADGQGKTATGFKLGFVSKCVDDEFPGQFKK